MSDGRGRGRGRGGQGQDQRGGRGGRGGGTGFQGVRGGRGGGGGGGDYQGGGRGGGEYRGGGRGGGEFRGGRGGGEYRGGRGGEFRGGRGGGRGGFGGPPAEVYRGMGATVPQPDADITRLEDEWMKRHGDLVSKMAKLSVSTTDFFPRRPHFGTEGDEVILWANYFTLNVKGDALFRYDLRVTPKKAAKAEGEGKPEQEKEVREAKGVKLATLIKSALAKLPGKFPVATEYKAHVVSPQRLQLPADATIEVTLPSSGGRREETWCVRFDGPNDMDISGCKAYLLNPADTGSDAAFPKFTDELDAFGVVLGHTARSDGNTSAVGRNRFFAFDQRRVDGVVPAQSLLHILRGYFQSVRPATGRLLLNVNVTHGVFRRSLPLAKLFDEFSIRDVNQDIKDLSTRKTLDRIQKFLSRSRIRCRVLPSGPGEKEQVIERTIAGLATVRDGQKPGKGERPPEFRYKSFPYPGPATARFYFRKPESGRAPPTGLQYETMVTVADYYKHKYGCIALGYPLINVGTSGRPIYVLAEHCELLPGQPIKTKLSAGEQDAMVRFACRKPGENATSITTSAREVLALDNNPLLGKFGITVDKELITVKGRELRAPAVDYAQGKSTSPREGGWNMMGMKVFKPGRPIKSWTFLHIQQRGREFGSDTVKEAVSAFAESMQRNMGINISGNPNPPNGIRAVIAHEDDPALKGFFRQLQGVKPDFVLVVLPQKSTALYNMVKKFADVEFGLTTVCVVQDKFTKRRGPSFDPGYFANVGLKVNLKFGGVNHQVKDPSGLISGGKTMFVGYDVTHPTNLGPGAAENAPSLVGLVASVDSHLGQWPAVAWQNPSRAEMVDNTGGKFVSHFKDRLRLWQQKNQGRLPLNIVIFRDGVSEGQFKKVLDEELPHMRTACQQIYTGGTQPRLALIVSVKRHHTRFFPTDPQHMTKSGSPKDGTVVDRGVTNVRYWDFYLQAHTAIQGTARPAHYTVLLDEIFRADYGAKAANVLEKLTHNMCYLFGRATRAVSICPPAYYADLVCTRGRVHQSELFDDVSSMTSGDQSAILGRTVHENLKNTMYYM